MKVVKVWEAGEQGEHLCVGRGTTCLAQPLPSVGRFWRWSRPGGRGGRARSFGLSRIGRRNHIPVHCWNNEGSCVETASYPRHVRRSFKHPYYELKNHSYSPSFSVRKASCFPPLPIQCSASTIFLLISSSSRGQAGERRGVTHHSRWSRVIWTC